MTLVLQVSRIYVPLDTVVVQMNSIAIWPGNDYAVLGMFVKSNRGRPYRNGTWFKLNKY